jgi:hypothetical protein
MWPFKNSKKTQELENPFEKLFPLGSRFNYLGLSLIVTGHYEVWPGLGMVPRLTADYVDRHGRIQSVTFALRELPGLRAENPC